MAIVPSQLFFRSVGFESLWQRQRGILRRLGEHFGQEHRPDRLPRTGHWQIGIFLLRPGEQIDQQRPAARFRRTEVQGRQIAAEILAARHLQLFLLAHSGQQPAGGLRPDAGCAEAGPDFGRIGIGLCEAVIEDGQIVHVGGRPGDGEGRVGIMILSLHAPLPVGHIGDVQRFAPHIRPKRNLVARLAEIPPRRMTFLVGRGYRPLHPVAPPAARQPDPQPPTAPNPDHPTCRRDRHRRCGDKHRSPALQPRHNDQASGSSGSAQRDSKLRTAGIAPPRLAESVD